MRDLTRGPIPGHIVAMAAPIAVGMLVQTLYYLVDLYFVSRLGGVPLAGVSAAGNLMFLLLALTQTGMSREDAYRVVQDRAMAVWAGEGDFLALLRADEEVARHLSADQLAACFNPAYHTKHVDAIFERVFQEA